MQLRFNCIVTVFFFLVVVHSFVLFWSVSGLSRSCSHMTGPSRTRASHLCSLFLFVCSFSIISKYSMGRLGPYTGDVWQWSSAWRLAYAAYICSVRVCLEQDIPRPPSLLFITGVTKSFSHDFEVDSAFPCSSKRRFHSNLTCRSSDTSWNG